MRHVPKILKNFYGHRQLSSVWNQHITKGLEEIGFIQSRVEDCMFYRHEVIFIIYMVDIIFAYPSEESIDKEIKEIGSKFYIEDKETFDNYIGINIESLSNENINLL